MQSNNPPYESVDNSALGYLTESMNGLTSTNLNPDMDSIPYHMQNDDGNIPHPIPEGNVTTASVDSMMTTASGRNSVLSDGDDEVDVVTKVMQPGASAQPLVDSIKYDLQQLSGSNVSSAAQ